MDNKNFGPLALLFLMACKPYQGQTLELSGKAASVKQVSEDGKGETISSPDDPEIADVNLLLGAVSLDPIQYTAGSMELKLGGNTEDYKLESQRQLVIESAQAADPASSEALKRICEDIELSESPDALMVPAYWRKDQTIYLHWRSHHSDEYLAPAAQLMLQASAKISCLLKIKLTGNLSSPEVAIHLDPFPAADRKYVEGLDAAMVVSKGVMVPYQSSGKESSKATQLDITDSAHIRLGVASLKNSIKAPAVRFGVLSSETCFRETVNGKNQVSNPTSYNELGAALVAGTSLLNITPKAVNSRLLKACATLRPFMDEGRLRLDLTCQAYQNLIDEGIEAGCAWDVKLQNTQDQADVITAFVELPKISFRNPTKKAGTQARSLEIMPKSRDNPVRTKAVAFPGFDAGRLKLVENAFDIWIASDPTSFYRDFHGFVRTVEFTRETQDCKTGSAGAHVPEFRGHIFYWCEAGAMRAENINAVENTYTDVYRAMTAYHETRHLRGWHHDNFEQSYEPCEGTSRSAEIAFNIVTKCNLEFCRNMRAGAIQMFKKELNYGYKNDNTGRKTQGLCKQWADGMGVKASDFGS